MKEKDVNENVGKTGISANILSLEQVSDLLHTFMPSG